MITFVYAEDTKGGIGYQNQLPWHLPSDLKFFKDKTMGHTMVMGRRTFESMNQRLLPGRQTIVISHDKDYGKGIQGLKVFDSIEPVLQLSQTEEIMVIGGSKIFDLFAPFVDKIYRTLVFGDFPADTFVKPINENQWQLVEEIEGQLDQDNPIRHVFQTWIKKEADYE